MYLCNLKVARLLTQFCHRVFTEDDKTLFNITNILNKTNMKKKEYEKPSMQVFELKQTGMLMTSGNEVLRTDYGEPIEGTWE